MHKTPIALHRRKTCCGVQFSFLAGVRTNRAELIAERSDDRERVGQIASAAVELSTAE
jgi:hypothetical protein